MIISALIVHLDFLNIVIRPMQGQIVDVKELLGLLTELAFKAAVVTKQCAQDPSLKTYQKKVNDPVTEADFKIQTMVVRALNHFYPSLRIVGEETTEYKGHIDLNLAELKPRQLPFNEQKVPIKELCVWIDPIDNTKGFIKGDYDCVTNLLGVSRSCKGYAGVVGLPYQEEEEEAVFRPTVQVGLISQSKAVLVDPQGSKELVPPKLGSPLHFVISGSRASGPIVDRIVSHYKGKLSSVGGGGKKAAMVAEGTADCMLYINAAYQKWDCCANDAILRAMGGYFTDDRGRTIIYDPDQPFIHDIGTITTTDSQLHKTVIGIIREEKSYDA